MSWGPMDFRANEGLRWTGACARARRDRASTSASSQRVSSAALHDALDATRAVWLFGDEEGGREEELIAREASQKNELLS